MKNLFTYLLMTAIGLSTAFAQSEATKTPVDGYSLENRLGISDQNLENDDPRIQSNQAKQLEGMLEALSGYGAAGSTVDIPFTLTLTNEDFEYADQISITFPAGFTINSVSNDDVFGPSFDNPEPGTGDPEPFNGIDGQTVSWGDDDNTYGGITPGATYTFTINVTTDGGVTGDQTVNYSISGDGFGANPGGIDETLTLGAGQSVAGIVASSADHTTLEVAVDAAGLTGALATTDPITLFAPTDAAFDALEAENPGIIEALLDDPAGLLTDVMFMALCFWLRFLTDIQVINLGVFGYDLVKGLVLMQLTQILWQFLFFMKTDIYYVFVTYFRTTDLLADTQRYIKEKLHEYFNIFSKQDLSLISKREIKIIKYYSVFFLLGSCVTMAVFLFYLLPIMSEFLVGSVQGMLHGTFAEKTDGLVFISILVTYIALMSRSMLKREQ
jgi:hypothetical protein